VLVGHGTDRPEEHVARTHIQAVVFDLYETLITEYDPDFRRGPSPAERLGIPSEVFERAWQSYARIRMTRSVDYRDLLRDVCQVAGLVVDAAVEEVIDGLYRERLAAKETPFLKVERPVLDGLRRLRATGLRLGLLSNCSVEEVAAWPRSELAPLFDDVVFSYSVGHAKPDRAIYAIACERLGLLPQHCAFVGDGGSDELLGAARAGMRPYCARWFLDRWPAWRRHRDAETNASFPQLASLTELLSGESPGVVVVPTTVE
jgi:HAD superfamily hydrolase (TIGR01549 family)